MVPVSGAPGDQVRRRFFLPEPLKPKNSIGHISVSYDSTSIGIFGPTDQSSYPHQWVHVPDTLIITMNSKSVLQVRVAGSVSASADVVECDPLFANVSLKAEYTGRASSLPGSLLRKPSRNLLSGVEFRATNKGTKRV